MSFSLENWKDKLYEYLWDWRLRLEQTKPKAVYTTLSAMTLWPLVQAAQGAGFASTLMTLASVAAGVGGNLIAEQIQRWRDQTETLSEKEIEQWIQDHIATNTDIREALDTILDRLEAIPRMQESLNRDDWLWFTQTLGYELTTLGNSNRFAVYLTGAGAVAQGEHAQATGAGGVLVGENAYGPILVASDGGTITYTSSLPSRVTGEQGGARRRYLARLYRYCQILPLAALGGDEGSEQDLTLDQVYVALDATGEIPPSKAEQRPYSPQAFMGSMARSVTALEATERTSRLVLLGDPGAGKSTFVRKILAWLAMAHLDSATFPPLGISRDLLPILIILRELAPRLADLDLKTLPPKMRSNTLARVVREHILATLDRWEAQDFAEELREAITVGHCLLVLDGLDEVPYDLRERVREAVGAVINEYAVQRMVVTCRVRSYTGAAVLSNFHPYTLAAFDHQKIHDFVYAWYNAQRELGRFDIKQAQQKADDLATAASTHALQELAANPMMLTTMAIIHQREIGLPKERVRLYSLAVEVLMRRWQQGKTGEIGLTSHPKLDALLTDDRRLRPVLEALAYHTHCIRPGYDTIERQLGRQERQIVVDLPRGEALILLEQRALLGDIELAAAFLDYVDQRAGSLVGQGGEIGQPVAYSFPHRSFQEYLAACHLVCQRHPQRVMLRHVHEADVWSEVMQLAAEELLYNRPTKHELLDLAYQLCPEREVTNTERERKVVGGIIIPEYDELTAINERQRQAVWASIMAAVAGREAIEEDTESPQGSIAYVKRLCHQLVTILSQGKPEPLPEDRLPPRERLQVSLSASEWMETRKALFGLGTQRFNPEVWYLPDDPLLGFIEIPTGPFLMGSNSTHDPNALDEEQPQHEITLPRYYITRYPVTVAQFQAFIEASGYNKQIQEGLRGQRSTYPVVQVSWYDAMAYCHWLTACLKSWLGTPTPLAHMLREQGVCVTLPSEAEWEKAARSSDGRLYPWGDTFDPSHANHDNTHLGMVSPVGCYPGNSSPYGVEEMSGNVWEWTRSVQGKYPYPQDKETRAKRENLFLRDDAVYILRGGSYVDFRRTLRCAYRGAAAARDHDSNVGFRVVLTKLGEESTS
jgi:formylglycine-generating enzyme required for sulfatase activity